MPLSVKTTPNVYDFDTLYNRRNTQSLKWDVQDHELAMWVADMDFHCAFEIQKALERRLQIGIYGYSTIPPVFFESIQTWWKTRHHMLFDTSWMLFCTGVVPAISSLVRAFTKPHESVLIQSPVYNIFYNSIIHNQREVLSSDLVYDGSSYHIDFEDLEAKLANPNTTLMILCNPHNPLGILWDRSTLQTIGELCEKHHVLVISDEIHCDIVDPDKEYTPFMSVSDICLHNSITCVSATKAFNLAGLQTACIIVENPQLRQRVYRCINNDEIAEPNFFAIDACIAAFQEGVLWLQECNQYIYENKQIVKDFLTTRIPSLTLLESHATYLLWIDCRTLCDSSEDLQAFLQQHSGLLLSSGEQFGANANGFLRMNIACPKKRLLDGLQRLKEGIETYRKDKDR